jgi:hypothetical protein
MTNGDLAALVVVSRFPGASPPFRMAITPRFGYLVRFPAALVAHDPSS